MAASVVCYLTAVASSPKSSGGWPQWAAGVERPSADAIYRLGVELGVISADELPEMLADVRKHEN
jgi:hypothetical protein